MFHILCFPNNAQKALAKSMQARGFEHFDEHLSSGVFNFILYNLVCPLNKQCPLRSLYLRYEIIDNICQNWVGSANKRASVSNFVT